MSFKGRIFIFTPENIGDGQAGEPLVAARDSALLSLPPLFFQEVGSLKVNIYLETYLCRTVIIVPTCVTVFFFSVFFFKVGIVGSLCVLLLKFLTNGRRRHEREPSPCCDDRPLTLFMSIQRTPTTPPPPTPRFLWPQLMGTVAHPDKAAWREACAGRQSACWMLVIKNNHKPLAVFMLRPSPMLFQ